MNAKITLGRKTTVTDGDWYAVGEWDCEKRAYVETAELGLYALIHEAQAVKQAGLAGMRRIVRYTVRQGAVTTRKELPRA